MELYAGNQTEVDAHPPLAELTYTVANVCLSIKF